MKNLYLGLQGFVNDEDGVTAIEYSLIAALIAVVMILAVTQVGAKVKQTFMAVCTALGGTGLCTG